MRALKVGDTTIPYALRRSASATRARIVVTPGHVDILAPESATEEQIEAMLQRRRGWLVTETRRMEMKAASVPGVVRFTTGAKIPFRGRQMRLRIEPGTDKLVTVAYRNGFIVGVPAAMEPRVASMQVEIALRLWMKRQLRADVVAFVKQHGAPNGLKPQAVRIKEQKHLWGSCGLDRVVNMNWQLIFGPKSVLEYAVVHELCHLKHRTHGPEFWALVGSIIPDWESRKAWLDQNEHLLGLRRVEAG